jgi:hypothetical protein
MLSIPFFENNSDGSQCMQVTMKSVIKYFLDEDISLAVLDEQTGRRDNLWTRTSQGVIALHELGLHVRFFSNTDIRPFLWGEAYIKDHYGEDAQSILSSTDIPALISSINSLLTHDIFEQKMLWIAALEDAVKQGHVPIVLIDANKINWNKNWFQGHYVIVTWFDDDHIFYHDSWPKHAEPHKKTAKIKFLEAMQANGTDNDVILVYGKR